MINLITPQRIGLADYEKCLMRDGINVVQRQQAYRPMAIDRLAYINYVNSHTVDGINHFTDDWLGYLLHFTKNKKNIITCHGINIPYLDYVSWASKQFYSWCLRGLEKADRVLTVSEWAKRDVLIYTNVPEDKITVTRLGVDHTVFYPNKCNYIRWTQGLPDRTKIILYVGSEQPRKNLSTLIRALAYLKSANYDFHFVKVGAEGWAGERKKLMKLIDEYKLTNHATFTGPKHHDELRYYYNSADVFAFPSYSEGFGMPPLEAMACGLPVVTTDCTSIPEVVGHAALQVYYNPFDYKQLAEKILAVDDHRDNMIRLGIEQAAKFSWEQYRDSVWKVYDETDK